MAASARPSTGLRMIENRPDEPRKSRFQISWPGQRRAAPGCSTCSTSGRSRSQRAIVERLLSCSLQAQLHGAQAAQRRGRRPRGRRRWRSGRTCARPAEAMLVGRDHAEQKVRSRPTGTSCPPRWRCPRPCVRREEQRRRPGVVHERRRRRAGARPRRWPGRPASRRICEPGDSVSTAACSARRAARCQRRSRDRNRSSRRRSGSGAVAEVPGRLVGRNP